MEHYQIMAIKKEKAFIRKLSVTAFKTVNQHTNTIEKVTHSAIYIRTYKGRSAQRISRSSIRKAIYLLSYKRSVTRKQLQFCNFNSAVMGLLLLIFPDVRIQKSPSGLVRICMAKVRFFFAGCDRLVKDLEDAKRNGAKFVLVSYYHIRDRPNWYRHIKRLGLKVLLDSGAFTAKNAIQAGKNIKPLDIEEYAEFIRVHDSLDILYGYFNLDVIGNEMETHKNYMYLKEKGLNPIPIWHVSSSWSLLADMVNAANGLVGIGGSVFLSAKKKDQIFTELFKRHPGHPFHALGCGSSLIVSHPFESADCTNWLMGRKFRVLITPVGQRTAPTNWTASECMTFNVRYLSSLENQEGEEITSLAG